MLSVLRYKEVFIVTEYVLEARNIRKQFPGVKALNGVNFQLKKGEIHALMGENGAGKSTFIKIITGVHKADEGEIFIKGKKVEINNPNDAKKLGIAVVHQQLACYPHLSITENIFIGQELVHPFGKRLLWRDMHKKTKELLNELGVDYDPFTPMGALSIAQQEIVEIAKAISTNAEIIIMDEPTAALTKKESEELYRIIEQLKAKGTSIIFVSHRMEDVYRLADRITVFRDGQYIGTWDSDKISTQELIVAMVGREVNQLFPKKQVQIGEEILRIEGLTKTGYFRDVSFNLRKGEILALTGLVGAGRSEVCQAIAGILKPDKGKIFIEGKVVKISNPSDALRLGIGYLPEDRQEQGLIVEWEIFKNISLPVLQKFANRLWLNVNREITTANDLASKVNVKARSVFDKVSSLSGGNQQKVVVAKLLNINPKIIIMDEPTKGIDVGAKAAIHELMSELAGEGYGIIMISSEMPEVLGMADRVVVMCEGRVTAVFDRKEATQEKILEAAMTKMHV